jgi:aldose sugar dehydrogenase
LFDVNVATQSERGMLGIAMSTHKNGATYVFLYYTEAKVEGSDICPKPNRCERENEPLGNRLYRYELINHKLVNPKLLLDLPATPGAIGNSGKILLGPHDKNVYIAIGGVGINGHQTKAQNVQNGRDPDGTSGILVITQDGKEAIKNGRAVFLAIIKIL